MKKIYLILLLFFVFRSYGQSYYPMFGYHHTWYIGYSEPSTTPRSQIDDLVYSIMDANGDTLVGSNYYYKAKLYRGNYLQVFDTTLYFREDTALQKVWILLNDSGKEKLIYDYSLNKGDSIYLDFDFQDSSVSPYYTKTGWYHIDSAKIVPVAIGQRKALFLSNPNNTYNTLLFHNYPEQEWIEGVGSTIMPDYTQRDIDNMNAMHWGYFWNFFYIMLCSFDDSQRVYHNPTLSYSLYQYTDSDSCLLAIDDDGIATINKPDLNVVLFPNPCEDVIHITAHLPQTSFAEIEIFNVTGIKIFDSQFISPYATFQSAIDVSQYTPGMYFIRLSTPNDFEMNKFVKY